MTKKTLGEALRKRRETLGMTQRELAHEVGVKASHIAYLESGQRGPSLPLIGRLADTLGLDRRELFFLSHPDAKNLVGALGENAKTKPTDAWRRFASNRALLRRHRVTRDELRVLKQVSLIEHVSYPSHFLFILTSIRQAAVHEE
jgi:transcriptional regulator with XRE-family HTH domain